MKKSTGAIVAVAAAVSIGSQLASMSSASANPRLEQAVNAYTKAFSEGNSGEAWSIVSERCQLAFDKDEFMASVAVAGDLFPNMTNEDVRISTDNKSSDRATVSYKVTDLDGSYSDQHWVRELSSTGKAWHYNEC